MPKLLAGMKHRDATHFTHIWLLGHEEEYSTGHRVLCVKNLPPILTHMAQATILNTGL